MKKAKFLIYAALAASTVAISSCSDNDVLDSTKKKVEGSDIIVSASVDGSRATALTSDNFTSFKLFGYQNPATGTDDDAQGFLNGADGVDFTGELNAAWTTTGTAKWPTTNTDRSCNFYALSLQGRSALGENIDPSGLQSGSFIYTSTLTGVGEDAYVDPANQQDLMVAANINRFQSTNGGVVNLPFKHAFALVNLSLGFDVQAWSTSSNEPLSTGIGASSKYAIDYIALHNVKVNGTFTFTWDSEHSTWVGTWSPSGNGTIKYVYGTTDPLILDVDETKPTSENPVAYQPLQKDPLNPNLIMMVPQKVNDSEDNNVSWPADNKVSGASNYTYLEVHGVSWDVSQSGGITETPWENPTAVADEEYMYNIGTNESIGTSIYCPLPADFTFVANKKYNLRFNLAKFYNDNGIRTLTGAYVPDE